MDFEIPSLVSLCAFDGIPPREEGADPTVLYFYPKTTEINDQFNIVGLYMTFLGFCNDFGSNKECEFFQTDKGFTCFYHLGSKVYCAASFANPLPHQREVLIDLTNLFGNVFSVVFTLPTRDSVTGLIEQNNDFSDANFVDLIEIFKKRPYFYKMKPVISIWTACERVLATAKHSLKNVNSGLFLHKERLVHSTMCMKDTQALYFAYYSSLKRLIQFAPEPLINTFQWITALITMPDKEQKVTFLPTVNLKDGLELLAIIKYNDLVIILSILLPLDLKSEVFIPLEQSLMPLLPSLCDLCNKSPKSENSKSVFAIDRINLFMSNSMPEFNFWQVYQHSISNSDLYKIVFQNSERKSITIEKGDQNIYVNIDEIPAFN